MKTRILIVKLSALGDVVMALSAIQALRKQYPDAHVTWMTGQAFVPLVRQIRGIDEVLDVNEKRLLAGTLWQQASELLMVAWRLAGRHFDLVLNGHSDRRYGFLTMSARKKVYRSFGAHGRFPLQGRHHCDEYVRLVTSIDGPHGELPQFPEISVSLSDELVARLARANGQPVVAIAPGGAKNVLNEQALKRWPAEHYAELAKMLIARGIHVVVSGDRNDHWTRDFFRTLPVIDVIGKTSILDLVALYKSVDIVVTHDSGPLHIALLAGTPVLALFGPTMPYAFGPMARHRDAGNDSSSEVIWGGEFLPCRPCYDGRNFSRCTGNVCLQSVPPQEVMRKAEQMLKERLKLC